LHGQAAPAGLEPLIMQMVEKVASKRPASMATVKQELERIATQRTPSPHVRILLWGLLALVLFVSFLGVLGVWQSHANSTNPLGIKHSSTLETNKQTPTTSQNSLPIPTSIPSPTFAPTSIPTPTNTPTPTPSPTLQPTPTPSPTPQPSLTTMTVSATQGWQASGIFINAGDQVIIRYISGLWTSTAGTIAPFDGAGRPDGYTCANYLPASQCVEPVPDAVQGALVGKVGTELLKIDDYLKFTATQGGTLYLRMNDGDAGLYDNQGSITVQIEVS
jgi:hypothetical protein